MSTFTTNAANRHIGQVHVTKACTAEVDTQEDGAAEILTLELFGHHDPHQRRLTGTDEGKVTAMYIGLGTVVLILVIVAIVLVIRGAKHVDGHKGHSVPSAAQRRSGA